MSREAKTVSELCREALDLRGKATQGEWTTAGDIYIFSKDVMVADNNDDEAVLRARGVGGGMSMEQQRFNIAFCAHSANNIKQIAERCLKLEAENQKLREALEKALDELELFKFAKDPLRVYKADTILRDALKDGQGE